MNNRSDTADSNLSRLLVVVLLVGVWQGLTQLFNIPHFLLPSPHAVAHTLWQRGEFLAYHGAITSLEMVIGLLLGCMLGIATAMAMMLFGLFRRLAYPLVIISQTLPVFAIAPLLVIWLGYGLGSKIAMTVLIIYFPICTALYFGLRDTRQEFIDLAQLAGAGPVQILTMFRIPAALPALATGLRVSASMAPIGAVVGEWVGSSAGLGFVMLHANARMQTDETFAALVILAILALLLRGLADRVARYLTQWN